VQAPIAPPYAEALLLSRRRAEKNVSTSDQSTDFSEIDIEAAIERGDESSISGIKSLNSASNDPDNKPSTAAKTENEEKTVIDGLQNLCQLNTFDYNTTNEYEDESLTSEVKRMLVISADNKSDEPNTAAETAKDNNEKKTDDAL